MKLPIGAAKAAVSCGNAEARCQANPQDYENVATVSAMATGFAAEIEEMSMQLLISFTMRLIFSLYGEWMLPGSSTRSLHWCFLIVFFLIVRGCDLFDCSFVRRIFLVISLVWRIVLVLSSPSYGGSTLSLSFLSTSALAGRALSSSSP